jgi:hypothetical protein
MPVYTGEQFLKVEVVGTDPVQRRQGPMEDMVGAAKFTRRFNGNKGVGVLNDADDLPVPGRIGADGAEILFCKVETGPAQVNPLLYFHNAFGQTPGVLDGFVKNKIGEPGGGFFADPRETGQFLNQSLYGRGV